MNENEYRRTGSPEVDAAWASLGIHCKSTVLEVWRRLEDPFADTEDQTELLSSLRRKARRVGSQNIMRSEPNFTGAVSLSTWRDYTIYTVWYVHPLPLRSQMKSKPSTAVLYML